MAITIEKSEFVTCTCETSITKEDFIRAYDEAIGSPEFAPGDPILFDFRTASLLGLSYDDCAAIAKHEQSRRVERGAGRCALTVGQDADYGVSRMLQALRDCNMDESQVSVFRNLDEAKTWLATTRADQD